MIRVSVSNNVRRNTITVDENTTTLRQAFEMADAPFTTGVPYLNGTPVAVADLDATFSALTTAESCTLTAIVKGDGGVN